MSEKKVGKRLLTWLLVLVMTLSLLPLNVLASVDPASGDTQQGTEEEQQFINREESTSSIDTEEAAGTRALIATQAANDSNKVEIKRGSLNNCAVYYAENKDTSLNTFNSNISHDFTPKYSIVFFVAPDSGYALTKIAANHNAQGAEFFSIANSKNLSETEFCTKESSTGTKKTPYQKLTDAGFGETQLNNIIDEALKKGCVAAFIYSRERGNNASIISSLSFYTQPLATLSKEIVGYYNSDNQSISQSEVGIGDTIKYLITVTYNQSGNTVQYSNVCVTDDLAGYTSDNPIQFTGNGYSESYPVEYEVKAVDLNEDDEIVNEAKLTYNYTATFNAAGGSAEAEARAAVKIQNLVSYQYTGDVPAGAENLLPATTSYRKNASVPVEKTPSKDDITGYTFSGWTTRDVTVEDTGEFTMPDHSVTFTGYWTAKNDVGYTVRYLEEGTTDKIIHSPKEVTGKTFNTTVTEEAIEIDGYEVVGEDSQTITLDDYNKVITFYYKRVEPTTFTVTFNANGGSEVTYPTVTVEKGETVSSQETTREGYHFAGWFRDDKDKNAPYDFNTSVTESFTLTAHWTKEKYKVIYTFTGDKPENADSLLPSDTDKEYLADVTVATTPTADQVPGYTFNGWTTEDVKVTDDKFTMPNHEVRFTGNWTKKQYTCRVEYYQNDQLVQEDCYEIPGKSYLSTIESYENKCPNGYVRDENKTTPMPYTVTDTENVIRVYYVKLNNLSYTVNYYWNSTEEKVTDSKTVTGQTFDTSITESPASVDGYTPVSSDSQTITIGTGKNVITFYYYKNVELTANSDTVTYNGNEQSVSGFTGAPDGVKFTGITVGATGKDVRSYAAKFADDVIGKRDDNNQYIVTEANNGKLTINPRKVTLTSDSASKPYDGTPLTRPDVKVEGNGFVDGEVTNIKANGSVTYVSDGSKTNDITFDKGKNFKATNYEIDKQEGTLKITPNTSVTVTITGHKDTQKYDGKSHPVEGYDVEFSTPLYTAADFNFKGTAKVEKTDAGFYAMGLKEAQFENKNGNFDKVTFVVNDGSLTIEKRSVTLTSESASKRYDGTALTRPNVKVEGDGFVDGEVSNIRATGTITSTGSVTNTIAYKEEANFKADNYTIVKNEGTLTVTGSGNRPRPNPNPGNTVTIEDDDALGLNTTDHFAYIVGYGNGEVRPQNNITRAEVATIFFRLLTDDVRDENLTKTNRYSDVAPTSWYNTAVSTLSSMGIITGYPDGTFRPNAAITRAEFAAIAARFDSNGDKTTAKFSDIASHWAKDEISIAYNNGWITGYPDGTFGPQRDITRAETMTLVNRVLNRLPETEEDLLPDMVTWTDNANPKAWYYLAVQEATNSHYYEFKTNSQYEKWTELRETRDWTLLEK